VSQIVARKVFPLMTSRRPSSAHWCVTVMCRGPLTNPKRVFNTPPDLPKAASGANYPLDWWDSNGRADRPGLLRYDNALPLPLVSRLVHAFSDPGELVVDPMLGSGTTPIAAHLASRRFIGADLHPAAVRFAAARLLDEHLWPAWRQPALFGGVSSPPMTARGPGRAHTRMGGAPHRDASMYGVARPGSAGFRPHFGVQVDTAPPSLTATCPPSGLYDGFIGCMLRASTL
jgi:hypothetical protein